MCDEYIYIFGTLCGEDWSGDLGYYAGGAGDLFQHLPQGAGYITLSTCVAVPLLRYYGASRNRHYDRWHVSRNLLPERLGKIQTSNLRQEDQILAHENRPLPQLHPFHLPLNQPRRHPLSTVV